MNIYLWLLYISVGIISLLPILRLNVFQISKRYTYFKYLSIVLFVWTLAVGLRYVVESPLIIYYMLMLMYPVILMATMLVFLSLINYIEKSVPKKVVLAMIVLVVLEVIVVLTNSSHQLFLLVEYSQGITEAIMRNASIGILYYAHVVIAYSLLLFSGIVIVKRLYYQMKNEKDYFPFYIFLLSILLGTAINVIHVFIYTFVLDPTYIAFVLLTSVIYYLIYIRDVRLILKFNNNKFILNNLREMYLVVNHRGIVVDASNSLLKKFDIYLDEGMPLDKFMTSIKDKALVYSDAKTLNDEYDETKDYIHMLTKDISMPFLKFSGHLILFYDETKIQKYIHDMDYVMNHDLMTKIYNRNYLEKIRNSYEDLDNYSMIIFDLDGLKLMNDYMGHHAGDELLINFSKILMEISKPSNDIVAIRLGGDEFLLLIKNRSENEIESMIKQIEKMAYNENLLKNIGFSYGISFKEGERTFEKVMSLADINMYEMKTSRKQEKHKLEQALKSKSKIL